MSLQHQQGKVKGKGRKNSGSFRKDQCALLKRLLDDAELTDAVAIIGPEAQRVPIHKALLSNLSEPFKKALYGTFREGQTQELCLPDIDLAAWRPIQRTAAGLSPQLSSNNVVATLRGAQMYMIKELADECHRYIFHEVQTDGVLDVLTACILLGVQLPKETEHALWRTILTDCNSVLQSHAFLSTHTMVVQRLLVLDEFGVEEEALWLRLVEWTGGLKHNMHLIGSLLDNIDFSETEKPACKRCKVTVDEIADAVDVQARCLQALSAHIRFSAMDKTFFADNVMKFLQPEKANSILLFHVLGRPSEFIDKKREQISCPKPRTLQVAAIISHLPRQAVKFLDPGAHWVVRHINWSFPGMLPSLSAIVLGQEEVVTEIQLTAVSWLPIKTIRLSKPGGPVHCTTVNPTHSQILKIQPPRSFSSIAKLKWTIELEKGPGIDDFELTKIEVIGHMSRRASIAAMVRRKSADLVVACDRS